MQDNLVPVHSFEYLIIGAGPAGLQLAYYLESNSRSYAVLESGSSAGTFFHQYPRHRRLLSINKIYTGHDDPELNMRWDWNSLLTDDYSVLFKDHTSEYLPDASDMTDYLERFATEGNLNIIYDTKIEKVSKQDRFHLLTSNGEVYSSSVLVVATGMSAPHIPDIPGVDLVEQYPTMSIDPMDFVNQRVLIIGKGNSAFETADNLIPTTSVIHAVSPKPVEMAWKSNYVGHLRAINNVLLETYRLKSQNAVLDAEVLEISEHENGFMVTYRYDHADDEVEQIYYDRVIVCTGFKLDASIFDSSCDPKVMIEDRFPSLTAEWESVNVPNLYFAGTVMQSRDFRKTQSAFIHGFRYNVRLLARLLEKKYEHRNIASRALPLSARAVTETIISRVNRVSAHWQQPGFFCDLLVPRPETNELEYIEELTVDYAHQFMSGKPDDYFVLTLEFGQERIDAAPDIFAIERPHKDDVHLAHESTGIHPIVRQYSGGKLVSTHHVIEDFASEWKEDVHIGPLDAYLSKKLKAEAPQDAAQAEHAPSLADD